MRRTRRHSGLLRFLCGFGRIRSARIVLSLHSHTRRRSSRLYRNFLRPHLIGWNDAAIVPCERKGNGCGALPDRRWLPPGQRVGMGVIAWIMSILLRMSWPRRKPLKRRLTARCSGRAASGAPLNAIVRFQRRVEHPKIHSLLRGRCSRRLRWPCCRA